jgi:hypothetical protein
MPKPLHHHAAQTSTAFAENTVESPCKHTLLLRCSCNGPALAAQSHCYPPAHTSSAVLLLLLVPVLLLLLHTMRYSSMAVL